MIWLCGWRAHTGQQDTLVLEGAYHGNLASLIEISPYKFEGRGGKGSPPHVHKVPMPDVYRGRYYVRQAGGVCIADEVQVGFGRVRGLGLFIGIELVRDRHTLEPAAEEASHIVNRMKECGILLSTDGPLHNVIKIKPPLVLSQENADFLLRELDAVLV